MQTIDSYQNYTGSKSLEELVKENSGLVMKIAKSLKRKVPSYVEFDDMVQSGFVGLIEASKTYKLEHGSSFETFASIRIKGAILDSLRKNSVNSRTLLKSIKQMSTVISRLEQEHQRSLSSAEIAAGMNISMEEYDDLCQSINLNHAISVDDEVSHCLQTDIAVSPEELTATEAIKATIKSALKHFPQREQILLSLYYIEELTFKEIGEILEITEARVCQLHAASIAKLASKVKLDAS